MGRDIRRLISTFAHKISIHSPRMGRDMRLARREFPACISIHSPRMGRDGGNGGTQNTAPDFNPLSPHGERPTLLPTRPIDNIISIHSPRMGRDGEGDPHAGDPAISIHSPRMGRDAAGGSGKPEAGHFNPLSPHGERLAVGKIAAEEIQFQSTLPAWGETRQRRLQGPAPAISIHSPRMGRDKREDTEASSRIHFNPLSPHGERLLLMATCGLRRGISIHSPRMGRDCAAAGRVPLRSISIHSPRMGRDGYYASRGPRRVAISIHSPRMGRDAAASAAVHQRLLFQSTLPAWGET